MEMPIRAFGLCLVVLILAPQVRAAEGNAQVRSEAPEHPLTLTIPEWSEPGPRRFGLFTLLPPDTRGEAIKVMIPVGEIAARAAHALSNARYRRAERKAREAVRRDIDAFHARRQGSESPPK